MYCAVFIIKTRFFFYELYMDLYKGFYWSVPGVTWDTMMRYRFIPSVLYMPGFDFEAIGICYKFRIFP